MPGPREAGTVWVTCPACVRPLRLISGLPEVRDVPDLIGVVADAENALWMHMRFGCVVASDASADERAGRYGEP